MPNPVDVFLCDEVPRALPKGRILDLPAGNGGLSSQLRAQGLQVTPADLFPESFEAEGLDCVKADMNHPLPFEEDSFDGVICQEGIEHLENPAAFIRECRRVIRDGGHLWLTTPNFMDLSGRLSFFLTGMKSFHAGFTNEQATLWGRQGEDYYHGHAFSLPFFQLRYLLRLGQFDAIRLHGLGTSGVSLALLPLVYPLAWLLLRVARTRRLRKQAKRGRKQAESAELYAELNSQALSLALLCSRKIAIQAQRREGSFLLDDGQPVGSEAGMVAS